jgi:anti-sigma factor RsiW
MSAPSSCQRISEFLSGFLDGDLTISQHWEVKLHLEACAACARFSAELAATVSALHRLRGIVHPDRPPGQPN